MNYVNFGPAKSFGRHLTSLLVRSKEQGLYTKISQELSKLCKEKGKCNGKQIWEEYTIEEQNIEDDSETIEFKLYKIQPKNNPSKYFQRDTHPLLETIKIEIDPKTDPVRKYKKAMEVNTDTKPVKNSEKIKKFCTKATTRLSMYSTAIALFMAINAYSKGNEKEGFQQLWLVILGTPLVLETAHNWLVAKNFLTSIKHSVKPICQQARLMLEKINPKLSKYIMNNIRSESMAIQKASSGIKSMLVSIIKQSVLVAADVIMSAAMFCSDLKNAMKAKDTKTKIQHSINAALDMMLLVLAIVSLAGGAITASITLVVMIARMGFDSFVRIYELIKDTGISDF